MVSVGAAGHLAMCIGVGRVSLGVGLVVRMNGEPRETSVGGGSWKLFIMNLHGSESRCDVLPMAS